MIIYNVTINIEDEIHDEWLLWMKETHIPEVMRTGMFVDHSFSRLLSRQEDETGITYVIQYLANDMAHYEKYIQEFAPALQNETIKKFGNKFIAFRTLMERV
ncbi:MAG: DUF4286 family protein [Bacteroidia bacterium]|jgi:hypothetical protein